MNDMPFFSVIIPLYNKAAYISECVKSALNQTFENFEIIIVNDGSTDDSMLILEEINSVKIKLYHQENSGVAQARNFAATKALGNYLAFLDADDLWKPNHLETLNNSINNFPNAGLYGNNYEITYNADFTSPASFNFNYKDQPIIVDDFFKASLKDTLIWTSAATISKDKFFAYGMFNVEYKTGQDLDLWIRIALKDKVVFNPKLTMSYNKGITNSLSKSELNKVRYNLFNSFVEDEKKDKSLKHYLDLKRYGLALRTKINGETKIYSETLKTIDFKNLNFKQKVLLNTPTFVLRVLHKIRPFVINNRFYLKLFKS